eukprot:GHVP01014357.1.p1 GENE.GHVP01014357.1~~GHVP01014357.1.p1  ORF type:complete len:342 (+),score=38.36 GHVP01014357.1:779-1804(+)
MPIKVFWIISFFQTFFYTHVFSFSLLNSNRDVRGTAGNVVGTGISILNPDAGRCLSEVVLGTGYSNDLNDEDDYPFVPKCHQPQSGKISCFPESAMVKTVDGQILMKDLKIGDKILTMSGDHKPVLYFLHKSPSSGSHWTEILFEINQVESSLVISSRHLLFLLTSKGLISERADLVVPGDTIVVVSERFCQSVVVRSLKSLGFKKIGAFAPVTPDGTLIVDGVASSSFSIPEHLDYLGDCFRRKSHQKFQSLATQVRRFPRFLVHIFVKWCLFTSRFVLWGSQLFLTSDKYCQLQDSSKHQWIEDPTEIVSEELKLLDCVRVVFECFSAFCSFMGLCLYS